MLKNDSIIVSLVGLHCIERPNCNALKFRFYSQNKNLFLQHLRVWVECPLRTALLQYLSSSKAINL